MTNPEILDAGCGTGVPTSFLADRFRGNVLAIDPDGQVLEHIARENAEVEVLESREAARMFLF